MLFQYLVTAEVEKVSGPFTSRDALSDELREAIEGADPGSLMPEEGEYETTAFDVEDYEPPKVPSKAKREYAAKRLRETGPGDKRAQEIADWLEGT